MSQPLSKDRECDNIKWCPYHKKTVNINTHYQVLSPSNVEDYKRSNGPNQMMPQSLPNGGIFGGPQSTKPWANTPTPATSTNYIKNLLASANPPPGAMDQLVGTNRIGNNYMAMSDLYWYNPSDSPNGTYSIMGPL